jgi:DNA-binding protein HU-beta
VHEKEFLMAKTATKVRRRRLRPRRLRRPKAAAKASAKTRRRLQRPPQAAASKAATKGASKAAVKAPAKKVASKPPQCAASVLTLRNIAERLSEMHEVPKRQANEMLTQVVEMIAKSLRRARKSA